MDEQQGDVTVVGIGASAGDAAALRLLFAGVPADSGLAFVVAASQAPDHQPDIVDLLRQHTRMPVVPLEAVTALKANHAYVMPPHQRAPIDHCFRTLARSHGRRAIAVLLAGTGSNGILGIRDIRACGGLSIVMDPAAGAGTGGPHEAVAADLADLVAPLDEIPHHLLRLGRARPRVASDRAAPDDPHEPHLRKALVRLRARARRDFDGYRRSTLLRRMERRMRLLQLDDLADYVDRLRDDRIEAERLADDILLPVTQFFPDPEVFTELEARIIPALFDRKGPEDAVRVWVVGCATGEEAYSVAMLLQEEAARRAAPPPIRMFASDPHQPSLQMAREGSYRGRIDVDLPGDRLHRYFDEAGAGYRVRQDVRDLVVFSHHDLLTDPPFAKLDLIVCRNLLTHLQRNVRRGVLDLLHYSLNPRGQLVLGRSESLDAANPFDAAHPTLAIYRRRDVPPPPWRLPLYPLALGNRAGRTTSNLRPSLPVNHQTLHRQMLERHGPDSLLLDPDDRAVHLSAGAGRYLVHPAGEFITDIFELVRSELRQDLRDTVLMCRRTRQPARSNPLVVPIDGVDRTVQLEAQPGQNPDAPDYLLVLLHELGDGAQQAPAAQPADEVEARLRDLQENLEFAHRELRAVNQEHRSKVEQLSDLNDALQNLMAATDIATLFIDRQFRIMRYTPKIAELMNVRPCDLGRPLTDLTHRLEYDQMLEDASRVLSELAPVEREVFDQHGRCHLALVRPYRSADQQIAGAVLTFIDITRRRRSEDALRATEEQYRALVQASAQIVWQTAADGRVEHDSPEWRAFSGQRFEQWVGFGWLDAVHAGDRERVAGSWRQCVASGQPFEAEFRLHHADSGTYRWVAARAVPLHQADGSIRGWVGMITDITERKAAEASRLHFQRLFESAPGQYAVLDPERCRVITASDAYLNALGVERGAVVGRPLFDLFPDDPRQPQADGVRSLAASLARVMELRRSDVLAVQRYPVPRPDGTFDERYWSVLNTPVFGLDGGVDYIIHRVEDVTPFVQLMREQNREADGHQLLESRAEHMQADIALRAAELQALNQDLQTLNESLERRVEERAEQVRQLASSLAMAEHDERARVGRILHDNLQQLLYGVQLKLALLAEQATAAGQDRLRADADEAQHWLRHAITTTRQLGVDMSPPLLVEDNLADGLEWLQTQMEEMYGLRVDLEVDESIRLPDDSLRVLLFQSVRELLFNVVKHAESASAVVRAREVPEGPDGASGGDGRLAIEVRDEGRGFDPAIIERNDRHAGLGLSRIRDRLKLFGGHLEIDARPGRGSRLTVHLPRSRETPARDAAELDDEQENAAK